VLLFVRHRYCRNDPKITPRSTALTSPLTTTPQGAICRRQGIIAPVGGHGGVLEGGEKFRA
jgi:hypothetical protein